jgi:uncharacterized membrane protein YfcA
VEQLSIWAELPPLVLGYCATCVLFAGICRGFAGFGLSALVVTSLTLVLPPAQVVPVALLLEAVSSLLMLRHTWSDVRWGFLGWILLGAAAGTPLGIAVLHFASPDSVRIVISLLVLAATVLLWRGLGLPMGCGITPKLSVGIFSGVANGTASLGGLPVAVFLLAASLSGAAVRATLSIYLLLLNTYGAGALAVSGLVTPTTLARVAIFALPVGFGILFGHLFFHRASPQAFRRMVLILLALLALGGLVRSIL